MRNANEIREITKKARKKLLKREIRWIKYQIKQRAKNGKFKYHTIYDCRFSDEEKSLIAKHFTDLGYDVDNDEWNDIIISWKNKRKE